MSVVSPEFRVPAIYDETGRELYMGAGDREHD
jgi:hypothetical protein